MTPCVTVDVEAKDMRQHFLKRPRFAKQFLAHVLMRNIRIEEDLIDQPFNDAEKRLARVQRRVLRCVLPML